VSRSREYAGSAFDDVDAAAADGLDEALLPQFAHGALDCAV
jgi:hypothetical protein